MSLRDAIARVAAIEPHPGKTCGSCTACCRVVPVPEVGTAQYQTCPHLRQPPDFAVGCSIYEHRPASCRNWSCVWLSSDMEADYRPDRCGVIVDPTPDVIRIDGAEVPAMQFWALPRHADAWQRDPAQALVLAALNQNKGMALLWRMPPDERGEMLAIAFRRHADGRIERGVPTRAHWLGNDVQRFNRAQELLR
jgi:hypothetical protein